MAQRVVLLCLHRAGPISRGHSSQLRYASSLQKQAEAPVPADSHKPPSKERPPSKYPHLVFTAEPCIFDPFRKQSVIASTVPLAGALIAANLLPQNICWLGCLLLWPVVRCSFNISRTIPRLVLWTDPDYQTVKKAHHDVSNVSKGSQGAEPSINEKQEDALQPREEAKPPAIKDSTNEYDPWANLEEKEILLFTHIQIELMNNVFSMDGRSKTMVKLEDVEWLGYEEAVTDAGRELHAWRLLKVKDVVEPYNIFLSDRFDVALPSIVNANPDFKVCEVSPINSWDWIPLFGFKVDKMFEPSKMPSAAEPSPQSPESCQSTDASGSPT